MDPWEQSIQRDLTPFADPGTSITYGRSGRWLTAEWASRRQTRSAAFRQDTDAEIVVKFGDRELSYRAFLACPEMSDLLGLAGMMLLPGKPPFFVDTKAKRSSDPAIKPAISLLKEALLGPYDTITKIVFVTGDAGAGKTEVLKQLVLRQADAYTRGEVDCLYFYVNAQGRALARLDEALATELQDLRATLTYHAVPSLVRNGVLVPVIDGFDELLGVLGYEDAFSSLRRFIDELDGHGNLIASARSTYYQQEFLSRTGRVALTTKLLEIDPIDVLPWSDVEFNDYIMLRYEIQALPQISREEFINKMKRAFASGDNQALRSKPFFVAKTADLILDGVEFTTTGLLEQLVYGYVERERVEKLLDKSGRPLLAADQIQRFIQLVCDEMWVQETRALDVPTVRTIAELMCEDEQLSSETAEIIRERAPIIAFFAPGPGRERIEFEHPLFFAYFLANSIRDAVLKDSATLYSVISRSPLPEGAADLAVSHLHGLQVDLSTLVNLNAEAISLSPMRSTQVRENAGALVASMLNTISRLGAGPHGQGVTFRDLIFAGISLGKPELLDCSLLYVEFRRADLSSARFKNCHARGTVLQEVLVNPKITRLELEGFDPLQNAYGLRVRISGGVDTIFRQDEIAKLLYECGVPDGHAQMPALEVEADVIKLLENIMLKFDKSNVIWLSDPQYVQFKSNPKWPTLEKILVDARVLSRVNPHHKGVARPAVRRNFLPYQIMAGISRGAAQPQEIQAFWQQLRQTFPPPPPRQPLA